MTNEEFKKLPLFLKKEVYYEFKFLKQYVNPSITIDEVIKTHNFFLIEREKRR